ncbi:zinc finger protein on ecdysone puffs isoform X1 [Nilaparvata lugens]|uniref:zinc finger protein on ecdysone puffs isoform X1 n=1 Tax=Nilaparvata lugens TaxID=108931 RepID=UPI000B996B1F|nr:zinc finger protein on ecdysone puffs isoform X1 [Nilaparvata lugens]
MSYRRDNRRDNPRNSGGNYGGGGGGMNRRQNYGGGIGGGLNQVNPWQGGLVPGVNQLGLLQSHGQPSILSQLSSPEAQLAMATNLLNKILSPQEQNTTPPSLLSLPINRNMAAFSDSRSRWNNSYSDRRRDRPDRRVQPYSKSGSNRHQDGKSRFGSEKTSRFNSDKGGSSNKSKKKESTNDVKVKEEDKVNGDADEDRKSKRKEEDEDDGGKKKDDSKDDKAPATVKYAGIPQSLFACHVCHKNMWDATSFDKHVSGRRHQMMMEQQDETYKIKVELLRHEQRAAESQREMEIERLQRQGKKVFNNKRAYCTMCDLHFFGNLISHRKKDRHQRLKSFLHPKCRLCHKEFANRLEWDDHKLTASHLTKVAESRRIKNPGLKDEEIDFLDYDSLDENDDDLFSSVKEKKINFDMSEIPTTIEDYDPEKSVGSILVTDVSGFLCRGCNKFLASKEEVESHLHSYTHFKSFSQLVKTKVKIEKDKTKKDKPAKEGGEEEEEEEEDYLIPDGEDEDEHSENDKPSAGGDSEGGTWKRRKRGSGGANSKANNGEADEEEEEEEAEEEEATEEEEANTAEKDSEVKVKEEIKMEVEDKTDKYDPDKAEQEEGDEEEEGKTPRATRNKAVRGGVRGGKARRGAK